MLPGQLLSMVTERGSGAAHVIERDVLVARNNWMVFVSGFVEPVFYLFAIDVGLGRLVGDVPGPGGAPIPYAAFAAPALLAASAMNGAVYEATFGIFFKMRWGKLYDAMLATPMTPTDVALGEIGWSQLRGLAYAAAFMTVMAVMGLVASPWALLAIPAAILMGFAFGAVGMAVATYMRSWVDLDMVNLALLPLFLFSATTSATSTRDTPPLVCCAGARSRRWWDRSPMVPKPWAPSGASCSCGCRSRIRSGSTCCWPGSRPRFRATRTFTRSWPGGGRTPSSCRRWSVWASPRPTS
jgi:lipooligosaccharide transport system permease protein